MPLEFEHDASGFDLDNAYYFVNACDIAGGNSERIKEHAAAGLGLAADSITPFDVVDEEDVTDFHGFVGGNENLSLLVFRDVVNMDPWLKDSAMVQKPAYGGMIHTGFANALESSWDTIEPLIEQHAGKGNLWITGHGLGAALAMLSACKLAEDGANIKGVYTFGAPRIGDLDFYSSYAILTYRLVNNNDIFAHVPANEFPVGGYQFVSYKHTGSLVYFDRHGHIGEGTTNWSYKKDLIQQQLLSRSQPPTSWFQDHQISSYVRVVKKNWE